MTCQRVHADHRERQRRPQALFKSAQKRLGVTGAREQLRARVHHQHHIADVFGAYFTRFAGQRKADDLAAREDRAVGPAPFGNGQGRRLTLSLLLRG